LLVREGFFLTRRERDFFLTRCERDSDGQLIERSGIAGVKWSGLTHSDFIC
jgi:hypothetical protein